MKVYKLFCWCTIYTLIVLSFIMAYNKEVISTLLSLILAIMLEKDLYYKEIVNRIVRKDKKDE